MISDIDKTVSYRKAIEIGFSSIAQSFPGIASVESALDKYRNETRFLRIENYMRRLEIEFGRKLDLIENTLGPLLKSGEFGDLFELIIDRVEREQSDYKQKCYPRIFTNCLTCDRTITYDDRYSLIDTFDVLTERDLKILWEFSNGLTLRGGDIIVSKYTQSKSGRLVASLSKLEARGLIGETGTSNYKGDHAIGGSGEESFWVNRWRHKYFDILPLGKLMLEFIEKKI